MALIDIDGTRGSLTPGDFNPPKMVELMTAALTLAGFTSPPLVINEPDISNENLNVSVEAGTYTPAEIAQIVAILDAVAADPTRNDLTAHQQALNYLAQNFENKDTFIEASNVLELGIANLPDPPTLAAYRTVLQDTITVLAALSGTRFETHFTTQRKAQGLDIGVGSMTLAQCAAFDNLLHIWLTARKVDVVFSQLEIVAYLVDSAKG